jgi:hypothetical protein
MPQDRRAQARDHEVEGEAMMQDKEMTEELRRAEQREFERLAEMQAIVRELAAISRNQPNVWELGKLIDRARAITGGK